MGTLKFVRFKEPGYENEWGVALERWSRDPITRKRYTIDVWDVLWDDGAQGNYPGRYLVVMGDVPAPSKEVE